jgi:hypothetical protein
MPKNILFLFSEPFMNSYYEKFGIETLKKNGFDVKIWDISDVMHPGAKKEYKAPDRMNLPNCTRFSNKSTALDAIRKIPADTFVFFLTGYDYYSYKFYKALSDSKANYGVSSTGSIPPLVNEKYGIINYYLRKIPTIRWKKLLNRDLIHAFLFSRYPNIWPKIRPARLIIGGGERSASYPYPRDETTEILWAHNSDYDMYLKERQSGYSETNTAVFIDEYYPFHPDFLYIGVKPPIKAEVYYPKLNKLFDRVEKELNLQVVIAAHPRSNYELHPDYFNGRACVRGQTARLIKESKLVLAHASTALSFANLFSKPVIFITCKELDKSWVGPAVKNMAHWFGKTPYFIEDLDKIDWKQELTIDNTAYANYRQAYIKIKESEDLPTWQIVANRLKRLDTWS